MRTLISNASTLGALYYSSARLAVYSSVSDADRSVLSTSKRLRQIISPCHIIAEEFKQREMSKKKVNSKESYRTEEKTPSSYIRRSTRHKGPCKKIKIETNESDAANEEVVITMPSKFVGAHMSIAGGLTNAVKSAVSAGAKSFALFLRSQRQWAAKPLEDAAAEEFLNACKTFDFPPHLILPHGSYLLNCGSPVEETLRKSREMLVDELKRCEKLGLTRYNFHPGSTCGKISIEECLDKIGESINKAHRQTNNVMTVIENMSNQGNTVGGKFEELHGIIERVEDKSRIGVCFDTCHAFAAGFDLSSEEGYEHTMAEFDRIIGLTFLAAVHLNDSRGTVGSHLDRHEKIGKGHIGIHTFRRLMNDPRFDNIPLILETPIENDSDYSKEIQLLNSLIGNKT